MCLNLFRIWGQKSYNVTQEGSFKERVGMREKKGIESLVLQGESGIKIIVEVAVITEQNIDILLKTRRTRNGDWRFL